MKIVGRTFIPLFLIVAMLTSCNNFMSTPATSPTNMMETAISIAFTEIAETQSVFPTTTHTPTPLPFATPLPPANTPIPTSPILTSSVPTVIPMNNGLTWSECVVPNEDYARSDTEFLAKCIEIPTFNENDKKMIGEQVKNKSSFGDWRITIGNNYFETKNVTSRDCCTYQLIKNGDVILKMSPVFSTYDPNVRLWNIEGKLVWELGGMTPVIVVDGVNYNEKYEMEGSYFPYKIKGKLIYIAKKNGKFHMVYGENIIGAEFDSISMAYCCGMIPVFYGNGQYWFVGKRGNTTFVVSIQ